MYKTTFLISINIFFLTTCYSSSPSNEDSNVYVGNNKRYVTGTLQVKWFDQKLNHFDRSPNATTWKQRYMKKNFGLGTSEQPIFVYIGGEGAINDVIYRENFGVLAKKFSALTFVLEHRYYGESRPTEDMSVKNLKYLTIRQALLDIRYFIIKKKRTRAFGKRKWIVFGSSYSGTLAVWARYSFSKLIDGAVASSAPLQVNVVFPEYFQDVEKFIAKKSSVNCTKRIESAFIHLGYKFRENKRLYIHEKLNTCNLVKKRDKNLLTLSLASFLGVYVQWGYPVDYICNAFNDYPNIAEVNFEVYGGIIKKILQTFGQDCLEVSDNKFITAIKNTSWEYEGSGFTLGGLDYKSVRPWIWTSCHELGWFQVAFKWTGMIRDIPTSYWLSACNRLFGMTKAQVMSGIRKTMKFYNMFDVLKVPNLSLYNGVNDPWASLGYKGGLNTTGISLQVVDTFDAMHCSIDRRGHFLESIKLKTARDNIVSTIKQWIYQP